MFHGSSLKHIYGSYLGVRVQTSGDTGTSFSLYRGFRIKERLMYYLQTYYGRQFQILISYVHCILSCLGFSDDGDEGLNEIGGLPQEL